MGWIARLWRLYDEAYASFHGLEDLSVGGRSYLRFSRAPYRRRPVRLPDGTLLRPGDRVVLLHLHNESLAGLAAHASSPRAAATAFRRALHGSLEVLAARLVTDAGLADVRAIGALTNLWHGCHRFGFAVYPLASRRWARLVAAYQQRLRRGHARLPAGRGRRRWAAGRAEARLIWMSTSALAARYGAAASKVPTGTAA